MKKYEIVYIIHPDLEGSTAKITDKVKKVITDAKGAIISEESWGKKKLAYKIQKNAFGIYEFLLVEVDPSKIMELERTLRLSEEIIRSMVVLAEAEVVLKKERKGPGAAKKEKIVEKEVEVEVETPVKKEVKAKEPKKAKPKTEKEEKERLEELDEKLKKIIGSDS